MRFLRTASRGQSLVETLLFLPAVMLLLFGTIYVTQFGVSAERAQMAVRYGGSATFSGATSQIYSVARLYATVTSPALPTCPTPPPGFLSGSAPLPGPSSAPYWLPSTITASCVVGTKPRPNGGFIAAAQESTTATVVLPPYLSNIGAATAASASEAFVHPADPAVIMYCSTTVRARVASAVNPGSASPLPAVTPMSASTSSPLSYACP
jgi:hypothetical protein